jgi:predicted nucleotidyltransferase
MSSININKLLKELKRELEKALRDRLEGIILYGSYARGNFSEHSDVDIILLVQRRLTLDEYELTNKIIAELSLKYGVVISVIDYPMEIFERWNSPFLRNIKREGIKVE